MLFYIGIALLPLFIVIAIVYLFFATQKRTSGSLPRLREVEEEDEMEAAKKQARIYAHGITVQRATDPRH